MKLEVRELSKKYGDLQALKALNVEFTEGIYGILGPNGAGKSTFMNLLTDNLKRTGGAICLDGEEILSMGRDYRAKLGYMPQQQGFYEQFSAMEFLRYIGKLKGLKGKKLNEQVEELLTKVNLYEQKHRPMSSFSGGMRQRVLLAQALLGEPEIIIMDEPTAGLDPKERINIRNIVAEISKNRTVFIATHVVSDIECIANKVLLLKNGSLIRMESPAELIASVRGKVGEIPCTKKELQKLQEKYVTGNTIQRQEGLFFRVVGDVLPPEANVIWDNLTLEDVYMYYLEKS
ncbi:MAG: ATP-binding cassette domain-containing protein [Lachnospiraceae bacterium]|nr:ATP-binding cassette domain-containing protein [Lachnospiraceae bacterium]